MRLFPIILAGLLSGCGAADAPAALHIPADLLAPVPGWTGPVPRTEGQLIDAAAAEKRGRERANMQIEAIARIAGTAK